MDHKQNIRLTVAYDGTAFLGWQKTPTGPSIEQELERALEQILQHDIQLQAASRTDAGVHAEGQVVNFLTTKADVDLGKLRCSLNALIPKDIAVTEAKAVPEAFHPTLDNAGKEYHYWLCLDAAQLPRHRHTSWHCPSSLNLDAMKQAASSLIGVHDFAAFCNACKNQEYESTVREVRRIGIHQVDEGRRLRIEVEGNHFLYKMVRNIVGALVSVGMGKVRAEDVGDILASKDRRLAPVTAPAKGLTLYRVFYKEKGEG